LLSQESIIATHYAHLVTARTQHVPRWIPADLDAHAGQVAGNRQDGTLDQARLGASVDLAVKLRMADYIPMFANTAYRLTTVDQ